MSSDLKGLNKNAKRRASHFFAATISFAIHSFDEMSTKQEALFQRIIPGIFGVLSIEGRCDRHKPTQYFVGAIGSIMTFCSPDNLDIPAFNYDLMKTSVRIIRFHNCVIYPNGMDVKLTICCQLTV